MAFNPYYAPYSRPMGYYNPSIPQEQQQFQQPMQQFQQQMPINQPTMTSDLIFVLNETEATAYPVAPNNSVTLWDKNKDTVYIKSVNMQGEPSMRILDYKERTSETAQKTPEKHECKCGDRFVSLETFRALQSDFEALRNDFEELKSKPKTKTKKTTEESEDEYQSTFQSV
jgi:hypothetical protein